jgi:hypothetical protein
MSARRAWFSAVEYRPNPADPENGVIGLGFLIEFTTDKYWVVSAIMRAGIQEGQLASLDDLAKQLLEHRSDVIAKEINRVLPLAREPGEALALLSASNPWSMYRNREKSKRQQGRPTRALRRSRKSMSMPSTGRDGSRPYKPEKPPKGGLDANRRRA